MDPSYARCPGKYLGSQCRCALSQAAGIPHWTKTCIHADSSQCTEQWTVDQTLRLTERQMMPCPEMADQVHTPKSEHLKPKAIQYAVNVHLPNQTDILSIPTNFWTHFRNQSHYMLTLPICILLRCHWEPHKWWDITMAIQTHPQEWLKIPPS